MTDETNETSGADSPEDIAQLKRDFAELQAKFKAQQEERYGVAPEVQDALPNDNRMYTQAEVEDFLNTRFAELERQLKEAQRGANQGVNNDDPAGGGGEPVPHHIHLEDGRVITNHGGIGTHFSDETGVYKIVAAYPVKKSEEA